MFDRDREWNDLISFVFSRTGLPLGVVYGRRRQGKSWLLDALTATTAGFSFTAARHEGERQALDRLGRELGQHLALPPFHFRDWDDAIGGLMALLRRREMKPTVLDEIPYAVDETPDLPSVLQRHLDRVGSGGGSRLILCGSAFSAMNDLLQGNAPLRGRARLLLRVNPFDFRTAASFWGLSRDPQAALLVNAVTGGTPAYRDLAGSAPRSADQFDAWLLEAVLNPSSALFSEGILLLAEENDLADRSIYHQVLVAVAEGATRIGQIAERVARSVPAVAPLLRVLESLALVERVADPLRGNRSTWQILEPILQFHHSILQPAELRTRFERRDPTVWRACRERFHAQVLGPHFERMAREFVAAWASQSTLGGVVTRVGKSEVHATAPRQTLDLDVVALGTPADRRGAGLLAIGEAKASNRPVGMEGLADLERKRALLEESGAKHASAARLLLFASAGFTRELRSAARRREDVELIDLDRLYGGD